MRLLSISFLACLLGCIYWLGATVYSNHIEDDITNRSAAALSLHNPDASVSVEGRDVTVTAAVESIADKENLLDVTDNVWGVRKTASNITVASKPQAILPGFKFNGEYDSGKLHLSGLVDSDDVLSKLDQIHAALPPTTVITMGVMTTGAADLVNSTAKVETGIAALTQLNNGKLRISDEEFYLSGTVSDQDRLDAISQLLATRSDILAPLNVIQDITVDDYLQVTSNCRTAISSTMKNNVVNYKVDFYQVESAFASKLDAIADLVNGVCAGQIQQVLVEESETPNEL